jgi:hypothetical protein
MFYSVCALQKTEKQFNAKKLQASGVHPDWPFYLNGQSG